MSSLNGSQYKYCEDGFSIYKYEIQDLLSNSTYPKLWRQLLENSIQDISNNYTDFII